MTTPADVTQVIRSLREGLRGARDVETAAGVLVEALRTVVEDALAPHGAAPLRGMVHFRSERTGYRALVTREWAGADDVAPVAPSATVWSCVLARGGVAVDLGTQKGVTLAEGEPLELFAAYVAHAGAASVEQMLAREASHLVALPLRAADEIIGMASIELAWAAGVGLAFPDGPWRRDLEVVADLATPQLALLPVRPRNVRVSEPVDPLLPVLGEHTRPLVDVLRVFVEQDETILVSGPTGAGKSRLAEWCHQRSRRASGPFETANLLAVPESMQMAELFGWKKGAFTGAQGDHEGLVASADRGTLFLDEIDKLSLAAQAGLLRVLETRRFAPLGASRERMVDVRFIVATNADLRQLVKKGAFREDLYYRVNVLPVQLPPLSTRRDEIAGWSRAMLSRRHVDARAPGAATFADDAITLLEAQRWPGNLRQLDNVVRRAYALELATSGTPRGGARGVEVGAPSVARALSLESPETSVEPASGSVEALRAAAESLVERALAARREHRTLGLEELDVLRAAVLRAAVDRVGSVKDAYLLFGADALVQSRNHTAAYRREVAILEALEARLSRSDG